jgi:chromate transporter
LFENFYRFGSIVFGGGNLLIPLMYQQFVVHLPYITPKEFLTGVGFQQALPGPVFSIAVYIGGMTMKLLGLKYQVLGGAISAIAIFLPGTLLMLFLYPFWEHLRNYPFIKRALAGINAASIGLVLTTAIVLFKGIDAGYMNLSVILLTFLLLSSEKIAAPIIVLLALVAGWIL